MKNRGSRQVETEIEVSPPLLLLNKNVESKQSANLISESITYKQKSFGKLTNPDHDCFHQARSVNFLLSSWEYHRFVLPEEYRKNDVTTVPCKYRRKC